MRGLFAGIVLCACLASCGSFQRMHYRDLRKVPADRTTFSQSITAVSGTEQKRMEVIEPIATDTIKRSSFFSTGAIRRDTVLPAAISVDNKSPVSACYPKKNSVTPVIHIARYPIRRDWSPAIAVVMLLAGLLLIAYCIFVLPTFAFAIGFVVLLEIFFAYSALRLLINGFSIIRNRFRHPQTFKEGTG